MSADNWAVCPKCEYSNERHLKSENIRVEALYGDVSLDEFNQEQEKLKSSPIVDSTLREDYEIGILDGQFYIRYSGHCRECNFRFLYKHVETIETEKHSV